MPDWKITPARRRRSSPQREKSRFTYMHNFGEKVDILVRSPWLLQDGSHNVLVDTGCNAPPTTPPRSAPPTAR